MNMSMFDAVVYKIGTMMMRGDQTSQEIKAQGRLKWLTAIYQPCILQRLIEFFDGRNDKVNPFTTPSGPLLTAVRDQTFIQNIGKKPSEMLNIRYGLSIHEMK